jgi:hypothetical protein
MMYAVELKMNKQSRKAGMKRMLASCFPAFLIPFSSAPLLQRYIAIRSRSRETSGPRSLRRPPNSHEFGYTIRGFIDLAL